jgi:hypothetical protein
MPANGRWDLTRRLKGLTNIAYSVQFQQILQVFVIATFKLSVYHPGVFTKLNRNLFYGLF